jgi:hypothetical protein
MLTHEEFGRLRLREFISGRRIRALTDWEFMGRSWVGEAVGFSEWLRPEERPERLESLALDMAELPNETVDSVLARVGLPVRKGTTLNELISLLGQPEKTDTFAEDRKTFEFRHGDRDPYLLSCTVLNEGGLTYLVLMAAPGRR